MWPLSSARAMIPSSRVLPLKGPYATNLPHALLAGIKDLTKPVVLVSGTDPLDPGGHESYVRAHGMAAIRAGFEPHIFVMSPRSEVAAYDFGVVHRVVGPIKSVTHIKAGFCHSAAASAIERFLKGHSPPHLIHAFSTWGGVGVALKRRFAARGESVIPITSAYDTKLHEMRKHLASLRPAHGLAKWLRYHFEYLWILSEVDRLERRGYEGSQMVLVNYDSVRRLLKESYDLRTEIRRIPYASSVAFRNAPEVPAGASSEAIAALGPTQAPLILAVSRQVPRKGIDVLLRALAELDRAGASFRACIVGPGRLLEANRRTVIELGLSGKVAMPGWVEDSFAYLRKADVFVLPSLAEGSGSVSVLEALQAGIAVVASACDGIPEDLTDGEDGLLVPPGDVGALRDALARLLDDALLRRQLAQRGRSLYERRFSAAAFVTALQSTYRELGFAP